MSALESLIAAGGESPLMETLSYQVPAQSSAITQRKQQVRFYPTSASSLSPTGVRTVRIRLGGNDFLDPNVRLVYTLQNTDAARALCPVCGPWGPFAQVRLMSGGIELDNQPMFHRGMELHAWRLSTIEQQQNEAVYGWGSAWPNQTVAGNTVHPNQGFLAPGASLTVSFKPLLSVFTSARFLPLRYMPLELELTLAPPGDWLARNDYTLAANLASQTYNINNIMMVGDSLVLDEAVQESFYKSLLSNRVLSIPTTLFQQVVFNIPAASTTFSANLVRAYSRLSHVWITFVGAGANTNLATSFVMPTVQDAALTASWYTHPQFGGEQGCPSIRLAIGPLNVPDPQPVETLQEHWQMLNKALPHVPYLDRADFASQTFVSVFDLRRTVGDPTSALSTRSGDLLRIDVKNMTANTAASMVVTIWAMGVVSVAERGVTLLD
jgi:hypothetical protein